MNVTTVTIMGFNRSYYHVIDIFDSYQGYHSYQNYGGCQGTKNQMLPTVLGPESIRASSINESSGDNWTRTKVTSVTNITNITSFLAVHNSSLGDLVTHSLTDCQTDWVTFWFWNIRQLKSEPRDLWPLRHLIRVMRRHDMTKFTKTNTKTMTKTKTFWEYILKAILETCDLWDIWSEWWGDLTWPKTNYKYKDKKTMTMTKTNTFREYLQRAILETCENWDIWS